MYCMASSWFNSLRDFVSCALFPQSCLVCGNVSLRSIPLCFKCQKKYLGSPDSWDLRCRRCGRFLISAKELCVTCRNIAPFEEVDRVFPLYPYDMLGQELLVAWKIGGNFSLTSVFASCIARELENFPGFIIVPVPPRPGKIRKKGWDQIDLLSHELSKNYGASVLSCLRRFSQVQQKQLGREERALNLKGNIRCITPTVPKKVIILDDLMTTGATVETCAQVLKELNCEKVYAMTLFYD